MQSMSAVYNPSPNVARRRQFTAQSVLHERLSLSATPSRSGYGGVERLSRFSRLCLWRDRPSDGLRQRPARCTHKFPFAKVLAKPRFALFTNLYLRKPTRHAVLHSPLSRYYLPHSSHPIRQQHLSMLHSEHTIHTAQILIICFNIPPGSH